jgi:hypothetical protein
MITNSKFKIITAQTKRAIIIISTFLATIDPKKLLSG